MPAALVICFLWSSFGGFSGPGNGSADILFADGFQLNKTELMGFSPRNNNILLGSPGRNIFKGKEWNLASENSVCLHHTYGQWHFSNARFDSILAGIRTVNQTLRKAKRLALRSLAWEKAIRQAAVGRKAEVKRGQVNDGWRGHQSSRVRNERTRSARERDRKREVLVWNSLQHVINFEWKLA